MCSGSRLPAAGAGWRGMGLARQLRRGLRVKGFRGLHTWFYRLGSCVLAAASGARCRLGPHVRSGLQAMTVTRCMDVHAQAAAAPPGL